MKGKQRNDVLLFVSYSGELESWRDGVCDISIVNSFVNFGQIYFNVLKPFEIHHDCLILWIQVKHLKWVSKEARWDAPDKEEEDCMIVEWV